jgi:L-ribulose-5-phosphate 3-epimerase
LMREIVPMEIGLVFWADRDSGSVLRELEVFGLSAGQLGVPPELDCRASLDDWARGLNDAKASISSAVCAYRGEDYSDLRTIHETVGFTTASLREERIARTQEASCFAHALGIGAVSCHIGFIPGDAGERLYRELRDVTQIICDFCAARKQSFVLETGQETAEVLLGFIRDVGRENLKVNFDPANMVMYGSGDPIAALEVLREHVVSVHCKDARLSMFRQGMLGQECVLGDGEVDFPAFLRTLKGMGYRGLLSIEREEPDRARRAADIRTGVTRLKEWMAELDGTSY